MTESEFKEKWRAESRVYEAWGEYIVTSIVHSIKELSIDTNSFFKIPPSYRVKEEQSLLDKAFHRKKLYSDPYNDIEDKVGARFVVLLSEDIEKICEVIENSDKWSFNSCKNYNYEREQHPLLFTYQSMHYILRPKHALKHNDIEIPCQTPCEVQVRTILQHAYAELSHDSIYKSKKIVQPSVQRTVAKSMALIETTDGFFSEVVNELNKGPLQECRTDKKLDSIYSSIIGIPPHNQKSSIAVWDAFEDLLEEDLAEKIESFIRKKSVIAPIVMEKRIENNFYNQSIVFFVYWLLQHKKARLLRDWPLPIETLSPLASDIGISLHSE